MQPVTIHSVPVGNTELPYCRFGKGKRPFLILPGLSVTDVLASSEAVAEAYDCFTEDYTVYLFARKRQIPQGYTVFDMADDLATAFRALGIADADVFGASQGGMAALALAIRYPELIRRAVIGSSQARPNPTGRAVLGGWSALARARQCRELNRGFFTSIYSKAFYEQNRAVFEQLEGTVYSAADLDTFAILSDAAASFDCFDRLGEIRAPLLVLGAEDDRVLTPAASREIADKTGCACYIYPGYSHTVYDEAPDYRDRMLNFFGNRTKR